MKNFSVDDRGNVVQFYDDSDEIVATLDREAGPNADELLWDGGKEVTEWAIANGYAQEIAKAEKI